MNLQHHLSIAITHVLLAGLVLQYLIPASSAQLTISPSSSSTPCYGDVVTLVCHHPELANSPGRYLTSTPTWREDGVRITPSLGTMFESNTSPDSTSTTLTINITVDHFRNNSFYYSCLLVLAGPNGLPSGEVETSGNVTLDSIDLTPPPLTSIDSLASTITLKWSDQPCTVRYGVSWMYANDDGTTTTDSGVTELTSYTIPTSVEGMYTVSVEAVDGVGIVGPSTTEVVRSTYPQPTDDGSPPCKDRSLVLRCQESGLHDDRRSQFIWMVSQTINDSQLTIINASAVSDNTIRCSEVLTDGLTVTGVEYRVEPLNQPGPPVVTMATTDSSITLTWNTTLYCFESEIFNFVVIWNEIGGPGTNTSITVLSSPHTISGLQSSTDYQVIVQGMNGLGVVSERRVLTVTTADGTDGGTSGYLSLLFLLAIVLVGVAAVLAAVGWCVWRKRKPARVGCQEDEQLLLFQVTDAMNRYGVKILSVQGQCVSSDCDPCSCEGEPSAVNVFGTFKEKTLVLSFIKGEGEDRKKFLHDFDLQRTRLSADYCFAVWVGRSVPGKVRSEVQREVRVGGGDCVVLPVNGYPWKVGSPEENQFVKSLYLLQDEIERTDQVAIAIRKDDEQVAVEIDEKHELSITAPEPYPDAPTVEIHRMVKHILSSPQCTPVTEGTDSRHKPPIPSMYASPYATLESLEVGRSPSEPSSTTSSAPLISNQSRVKRSHVHRRTYTKDSLIDGVASVLEILHVDILSIGGQCRRPECQDGGNCAHVNIFQPDIAGEFGETSFVIKCVLYHYDRTVMADQLKTLYDVRKGMGLSRGLLVYDQTDGTPQVPSQQIPANCLLVPVGAFKWDCQWVRSTLLALYRGLCTPLTPETSLPTQEGVVYTEVKIDNPPRKPPALENVVYAGIVDIGEKAAEEAENRPPPLPQKREVTPPDPRDIQFQSDVIEVLEKIGVTVDVKEQTWFKGTYKSLKFLAACRGEPDHDLKTTDVDTVLRIRTKIAVTRAVFICNSDTIPMNSLLKLDEAKCGFVKAFGHGSEKWKGRVIQSFKDTVEEWICGNNPSHEESKVQELQEGKYASLQEGTDVMHHFKGHGEMVQEPEAEESKHLQQEESSRKTHDGKESSKSTQKGMKTSISKPTQTKNTEKTRQLNVSQDEERYDQDMEEASPTKGEPVIPSSITAY